MTFIRYYKKNKTRTLFSIARNTKAKKNKDNHGKRVENEGNQRKFNELCV